MKHKASSFLVNFYVRVRIRFPLHVPHVLRQWLLVGYGYFSLENLFDCGVFYPSEKPLSNYGFVSLAAIHGNQSPCVGQAIFSFPRINEFTNGRFPSLDRLWYHFIRMSLEKMEVFDNECTYQCKRK
ncbi:hypothetical protein SAMN05192533_12116 [Mesobacillus persicus]|uniref:Uncharacterized protein n=1 Tax=Mesobacillus persicus TaxID=930146 RepID=A0A1H8JGX6_9BACI|nr:hypothetical protein SAMN05192533_12116 [Mesobacillus persicus]